MKRLHEDDDVNAEPARKRARLEEDLWLPMETWSEIAAYLPAVKDWLSLALASRLTHKAVYTLVELRRRLPETLADPRASPGSRQRLPDVIGIPCALGIFDRADADTTFRAAVGATSVVRELLAQFLPTLDQPLLLAGGAAAAAILEALRAWAPRVGAPKPSPDVSASYVDMDVWIEAPRLPFMIGGLRDRPTKLKAEPTVKLGRLNLVPWNAHAPRYGIEKHAHHPEGELTPLCCFDMSCCQFSILIKHGEVTAISWTLDALCGLYTRQCRFRNWHTKLTGNGHDGEDRVSRTSQAPYLTRFPFVYDMDTGRALAEDRGVWSNPMARFARRVLKYHARGYRLPDLMTSKMAEGQTEEACLEHLRLVLRLTRSDPAGAGDPEEYMDFFASVTEKDDWFAYVISYE